MKYSHVTTFYRNFAEESEHKEKNCNLRLTECMLKKGYK